MKAASRKTMGWGFAALLALAGPTGRAAAQAPAPPDPADGPPAAWRRGWPGPPPFEDLLERHANELGLDAGTLARMRSIAATSRQEEQPLEEQLRTLHEGMHTLLDADAPAVDEVLKQADQIGAAETELRKHRLETMLEIRALLTPAQRQQLVQIFQAKAERWRSRGHGPWPGGPGGPPAEGAPPPPPPE